MCMYDLKRETGFVRRRSEWYIWLILFFFVFLLLFFRRDDDYLLIFFNLFFLSEEETSWVGWNEWRVDKVEKCCDSHFDIHI